MYNFDTNVEHVVNIYQTANQKVVDSYELYNKIGLHKTQYGRWVKFYKNRGGENIDWFRDEKLLKLNRKIKCRYYFKLKFARGICIRYVTKESNKLIVFLQEEMDKNNKIKDLI
jgi:predicted ATPase